MDTFSGNYLALDGGLSGLSGLITLEELLSRLQFDLNLNEELAPWQYFSIIIGTGHGGLIAIFIGRLKMTASEAIESYTRLLPALSVPPAKDDEERRRNTESFQEAFSRVLEESGHKSDTSMLDDSARKTIVVTSNVFNPLIPHFIRSYRVRGSPAPPCTILQAACACLASQDRFLPVVLGAGHRKVTLVDGLAGYANPAKELMREAQSILGEEAKVSTIISLGAGKPMSLENVREDLFEILKRGVIVCEQVHEDMQKRLRETSVYFRFNIEREIGTTPESIYACTSAYLQEAVTSEKLDQATKSIHSRPSGIKLKDINSVTTISIQLKPRPSLVQDFVGREDILEAMRRVHLTHRSSESATPAITVLSGLGGSGKTQVSLKFAKEFEKKYQDSPVYFLNAESEESLKTDYETLIRSLGNEHRTKSYHDALSWLGTELKNWLIILDNADNPALHPFAFIPKCAFGNVIITTRNSNHATLAPNSSYYIDGLSEADSVALVLRSSGHESNEMNQAFATEIVRELGNLPLALAQAAGYIFVNKCLPRYLNIYRKSAVKILASFPSQRPDDYKSSVGTTIQMSLDRLPQEAQDVLRILAHLDSTSIPHDAIARAAERRFEHVTWTENSDLSPETLEHAGALRAVFYKDGEWSDFDFNELVTQCLQYSLLQIRTRSEDNFYSMHVLVRAYLKASSTLIQGYRPCQLVVRLLGSSITYSDDYRFLAFNRLLLPHLRLVELEDVAEAGDHFGFGRAFYETGDWKVAMGYQERSTKVWRASLGDGHVNALQAAMDLANSYKKLGRGQDALELEEKVLELRRNLLGLEHPDTLKAMHNLAWSYKKVGRKEEAMGIEEQVLDMRKRILGPQDPLTLTTMNNLAASYTKLGRHQDGLKLIKQALEGRKKVLGPEHPKTLSSMYNLADSYEKEGRETEAMEMREQVLELRTKVLGQEHPHTLSAVRSLAFSLKNLGLKQRQLDLLRTTLPTHEKVFGTDHSRTGEIGSWLNDLSQEPSQV